MKKYIVKYKDGEKTFGEYNSRKEASDELMNYIHDFNNNFDGEYISPFDFVLEEVECKEVNEVISDFENARKALDVESNSDFVSANIADVARLVNEINPKHIEALIALNELFTIAEAWNKEDGFVPDYSYWYQDKWFPWFKYDKGVAGFVRAATHNTNACASASFGSRLCFKTRERAEQFGKQFAELYNKVFL